MDAQKVKQNMLQKYKRDMAGMAQSAPIINGKPANQVPTITAGKTVAPTVAKIPTPAVTASKTKALNPTGSSEISKPVSDTSLITPGVSAVKK